MGHAPLGTHAPDFACLRHKRGNYAPGHLRRQARPAGGVYLPALPVRPTRAAGTREGRQRLRGPALGIVAISSNDAGQFPEDGPDGLRRQAREQGFVFPYCYDESQDVARAYQAACTPDFFLFDKSRLLVYRGQLDGSRPKNDVPVTGADLRAAIEAVLNSEPVDPNQRPSIGCNIKWKR